LPAHTETSFRAFIFLNPYLKSVTLALGPLFNAKERPILKAKN
jgi:hypothetical protein